MHKETSMKLRHAYSGTTWMGEAMSRFRTQATGLVIAVLLLGASAACSTAAETFPTATPESQGLSSQPLAKLLDVVRGFAENGDIVGGELLVIKNRRTVL